MGDLETELNERRAALEQRRAARNTEHELGRQMQELEDLESIFELETEHGVSRIAKVRIPYTPGSPCVLAVRCPSPGEMKRYRDMSIATRKGQVDPKASAAAAESLATACLVYPSEEVYGKIREDRPGVHVMMGVAAAQLALGEIEEEGKD